MDLQVSENEQVKIFCEAGSLFGGSNILESFGGALRRLALSIAAHGVKFPTPILQPLSAP